MPWLCPQELAVLGKGSYIPWALLLRAPPGL